MTERRARGFRALGRRLLLAGVLALSLPSTQAQDTPAAGSLRRIDTRPGVEVPIYAVWRADARATVVLFSGGGGGFGQIGADGWPGSGNSRRPMWCWVCCARAPETRRGASPMRCTP